MVLIEELECNFWGLVLENGKRYTQTVERAFHISMAALEPTPLTDEIQKNKYVSLMLQHNKSEYILCTLEHEKTLNVALDLNFLEGEEVTFFLNGKGSIHLSGYLTPEMLDEEETEAGDSDDSSDLSYEVGLDEEAESSDESSDEDDDEMVPQLMSFDEVDESESEEEKDKKVEVKGKRKKKQESSQKKKKKKAQEEEEEEEEDEEDELNWDGMEDNDEDEEDLGASFVDMSAKSKKRKKKDKVISKENPSPKTETKQEEKVVENGATPDSDKKKKKKRKRNKKNKQNQENGQGDKQDAKQVESAMKDSKSPGSAKKPKKTVLQGGVIAEDLKEGHGPIAAQGKNVGVYYKGTLTNGKSFDETTNGKPFFFKLGKQEVIKGWDVGVKGMRVGGKRKLTIPAKMAYGQQRMGEIPPNSTLCFEVELKVLK